ncbi:MAG: glutamine amidotransferase [Candidatus Poribacteria bacterium]
MVYLINPINLPIIDEIKAKHPYMEARLEESLVNIDGEDYNCLRWYDVISKEQIAFFFNAIHEGRRDDAILIFNLVKMDISYPSAKQDLVIQSYGLSAFTCQETEASIGIIIENRGNADFEYKLAVELPQALIAKEQLDIISGKVEPKGKVTHNINVDISSDAEANTIQAVYFKINDMMPFSAVTRIRGMVEFNVTPSILTLSPGESHPILIGLAGNYSKSDKLEYEFSYPADFSLDSIKWSMSDFGKDNDLKLQQTVSVPKDAKSGDYELKGKVSYKNHEFNSIVKLRVTDVRKILLLSKDEQTQPFIDAILSDPANGLTWLTQREVSNLNWLNWSNPMDHKPLENYNLLILDELHQTRPLSMDQMMEISRYVEKGGNFLMFGGWESCQGHNAWFGGLYKGTPVEEIAPVKFLQEFDNYETRIFADDEKRIIEPFKMKCVEPDHPITQGIDWENVPLINGYNKCDSVKEHSKVLIVNEQTNDPILVIGEFGRGKTAIFLSCYGRGWAYELIKWNGFNQLWNNLIQWLTGK